MDKKYYQKVFALRRWCGTLLFTIIGHSAIQMMNAGDLEYAGTCAGDDVKGFVQM